MRTLKIKQGETFSLDAQYFDDDGITPKALTGVVLSSQVRNNNELVATLTFTVLDELAGSYRITAPEGTLNWPACPLQWDIKESAGGIVRLTETHAIIVAKAITRL